MSSPAAFPNTHTALQGKICWQRWCYSVCKTNPSAAADPHQPRATRGFLWGRQTPGLCLVETPRVFRPCKGLDLAKWESPRGDHPCPGAALPAGDMGTDRRLFAPQRAAGQPRIAGKIPFRSCICSASIEQVACPKSTARLPLLALGPVLALTRYLHPSHPIIISSSHIPDSPDLVWILRN